MTSTGRSRDSFTPNQPSPVSNPSLQVSKPAPSQTLEGHSDVITHVVEINGKILTVCNDGTVKLWSLGKAVTSHSNENSDSIPSGICLWTNSSFENRINDITIMNREIIVIVCGRKIFALRTSEGAVFAESDLHLNYIGVCATIGPNTIVFGDAQGNVLKARLSKDSIKFVGDPLRHESSIKQIFSRGDRLGICCYDGSAQLVETSSLTVENTFHDVEYITFDDWFLLCSCQDGTIRVYPIQSTNIDWTIQEHSNNLTGLQVIEGTNTVFSWNPYGLLNIHSFPSGKLLGSLKLFMQVSCCVRLKSGEIAVVGEGADSIDIYDDLKVLDNVCSHDVIAELGLAEEKAFKKEKAAREARQRVAELDNICKRQLSNRIDQFDKRFADLEDANKIIHTRKAKRRNRSVPPNNQRQW